MKSRHPLKQAFKQNVTSLITFDQELRDLSNKSFRFQELNHEMVLCVGFSPDGEEVVASGLSGSVKVFNLKARLLRLTLRDHKEAVNVCKFSGDGKYEANTLTNNKSSYISL